MKCCVDGDGVPERRKVELFSGLNGVFDSYTFRENEKSAEQGCRRLTNPGINKKGTTLLVLLVVASAITALGVFLDGEVIPPQPETEALLKNTTIQSSLSKREAEAEVSTAPSAVTQQLERAIEAANRSEADSAEGLEERAANSRTLIEETNRLLVEKGVPGNARSSGEKSKQFNHQLSDLKSRLAELKSSE
jgi:hypothetical protein